MRASFDRSPAGTVWYAVIAVEDWSASLPTLRRLLSESELARADRYRVATKGLEFSAGRAALRCVLGEWLALPPAVVEIDEGEGTKPRLGGALAARGIEFNVSHSAGRVALALAGGRRVGIDIEEHRPINHEARFAEMILSSREQEAYSRQPEERRLAWLLARWTAKEAYLKGVGRGLAESLSSIETVGADSAAGDVLDRIGPGHIDAATWILQRLDPPPGYVLTLAAEEIATPLGVKSFDAGQLLSACAGGVGAS